MSNPDLIDNENDSWTWVTNSSGKSGYVVQSDADSGFVQRVRSRADVEDNWGPVRETGPLVLNLPEIPAEVTELHSEERGVAFTRKDSGWIQKGDSWQSLYTLGELLDNFSPLVAVVQTPEEWALETLRNSPYPWEQNIMEYGDEDLYQAMRLVVNKALKED
jgi:hypothetical protein